MSSQKTEKLPKATTWNTKLLIFILSAQIALPGPMGLAQARKMSDTALVAKPSVEAQAITDLLEQYGTRPMKAGVLVWRTTRFMEKETQDFFQKIIQKKNLAETAVSLERVSATKFAIVIASRSIEIEPVSIEDRRYRVNGKLFEYGEQEPATVIHARLQDLLGQRTASIHDGHSKPATWFGGRSRTATWYRLLIDQANAQFDIMSIFSAIAGPMAQIMMAKLGEQQQANADCSAISQATQFCTSIVGNDSQRVATMTGLPEAAQVADNMNKSGKWKQATLNQCGSELQTLGQCGYVAKFAAQYGGFKECADPRRQGGGVTIAAYTVPCGANKDQSSLSQVAQNVQPGANIAFRKQVTPVRSDKATKAPAHTRSARR